MVVLIKVLQFLFSLSILVFIHELGHFVMAKLFKVRVEKFYIFFNPWFSLFKFKKGDTEYGVGWVPLGGYVKISGMIDESMDLKQMKEPPKEYEFRSKPAWQRLLIMIGGVTVNFLFAFFLYMVILFSWGEKYLPPENACYGIFADSSLLESGLHEGDIVLSLDNKKIRKFERIEESLLLNNPKTMQVLREGEKLNISLPDDVSKLYLARSVKGFNGGRFLGLRTRFSGDMDAIIENSAAASAGIKQEDRIVSVDGRDFKYNDQFIKYIFSHKNETVDVEIVRKNDTLSIPVTIGDAGMGVVLNQNLQDFNFVDKKYGILESIPAGFSYGADRISSYLKQFKLFKYPEALRSLGGFIAIGNIFPDTWDWGRFWNMTALLSLILGIMNLLPIPGLDGGHVLFLIVEVVTRRQPSDKFMERAQMAGMIFILLLLVVANGNDILKLFGK